MADKSAIEWTEATWNPVVGCSIVSPGCTHCYAMTLAGRLERMGAAKYAGLTTRVKDRDVWNGTVRLDEAALPQPLRWRRPRRIFVNSMSDLFHEALPDEAIDRVFAVMAMAPQHTFQVLTKRADRMRAYFEARRDGDPWAEAADAVADLAGITEHPVVLEPKDIPLPNVWLGVSVEDQDRADARIPELLQTPAAVRWLSIEPLLGPVDITSIDAAGGDSVWSPLNPPSWEEQWEQWRTTEPTEAEARVSFLDWHGAREMGTGPMHARIDWVVVGGESGPGARPMHPDWARSLRDQCQRTGTPFFFKQWGAWKASGAGVEFVYGSGTDPSVCWPDGTITAEGEAERHGGPGVMIHKLGKVRAGRELDGRTHDGMPA